MPIETTCRVLEVSASGYYDWLTRPLSKRAVRHAWLSELIVSIHKASHGTYGVRRIRAELAMDYGLKVHRDTIQLLMRRAGIQGVSGRRKFKRGPLGPVADDLVGRIFEADEPNRLWVTDITEHPTREGKVYCAVVLDVFSRRVVGWSIDSNQTASLTTNALSMAIENRKLEYGSIIHSDRGTQFTSWSFTRRAMDSGLIPSMGSVGDCYDNTMMESFWSRMQVGLLDRRKWNTRHNLMNAIFEYIEIFYNRKRRHSALGMLSPVEYETRHQQEAA
ncbi:MAG: IS3 family transposase [Myxococcota bacterium]